MKNRIRIESNENVVRDAKIFFCPEEGDEVDISSCVQAVDVHLEVGAVSRATLHVILVDGFTTTEVSDVIVNRLKRKGRIARLRSTLMGKVKSWVARSLSREIQLELSRAARRSRSPW